MSETKKLGLPTMPGFVRAAPPKVPRRNGWRERALHAYRSQARLFPLHLPASVPQAVTKLEEFLESPAPAA